MEFDASPWGLGGVLFEDGAPTRYFAEDLTSEDIKTFGLTVGDCACQASVENLAVLIGVRLWLPTWKDQRVTITIRRIRRQQLEPGRNRGRPPLR